ncbi:MAG TPA: hypothetical protein VGM29_14665 [Polyangiaceae bacterium]|jgi:hypothetical protein
MTQATQSAPFPTLFEHQLRKEWGVSVVSGEHDGKRRFLFEGGEERTMSASSLDLMRRVDSPNPEQQAAYARLTVLLAKRGGRVKVATSDIARASITAQLLWLRERCPKALKDEKWLTDPRRQGARRARDLAIDKARELLSRKVVDGLIAAERFDTLWQSVSDVLTASELTSAQRIAGTLSSQQLVVLGGAVRKLLFGTSTYEQRFDGFVAAFDTVFREPPSWELATALSALVFPTEHTFVEPGPFRKQLKALGRNNVLSARPSGAAYARCAGMARTIATELGALGEVPGDLFDVLDFVSATIASVKPRGKAQE